MRVGRKQHILSTRRKKFLISSNIFTKSEGFSFRYVTSLKNSSFNAIKVFKTNVTRSQSNGKDGTKIKYCRWDASRRLTNRSIVNNFKLEEEMFT